MERKPMHFITPGEINPKHDYALIMPIGNAHILLGTYSSKGDLREGYIEFRKTAKEKGFGNIPLPFPYQFVGPLPNDNDFSRTAHQLDLTALLK